MVNTNESRLYIPDNDTGMIEPITNESVIKYIQAESANMKVFKEK